MQRMIKLTNRQKKILQRISKDNQVGTGDILNYINKEDKIVARFSIVRDLHLLVKEDLIERVGAGRSTQYREKYNNYIV